MSDAPLGPTWWQAGDGKWYPSPPGLADGTSRAPTPPPDHAPEPPTRRAPIGLGVYGAGRMGATEVAEPPRRSRRRATVLTTVAIVLVLGVIIGVVALVSGDSTSRASSSDPNYQQAIVDLLGTETTNIVFLDTFWDDYRAHVTGGSSAATSRSKGTTAIVVDASWLEDMQAQVDQFSADLATIDQSLDARPWRDGTVADTIRDLARAHYQTWQRWAHDVPELARRWVASEKSTDLHDWIDTAAPQLSAAIDQTFVALCAELTDTAPSDHRFDATIDSICNG